MSVRAKTVMMPPSTVYLHVGFRISNSILGSFLVFNICHDFKLFFPLWSIFYVSKVSAVWRRKLYIHVIFLLHFKNDVSYFTCVVFSWEMGRCRG